VRNATGPPRPRSSAARVAIVSRQRQRSRPSGPRGSPACEHQRGRRHTARPPGASRRSVTRSACSSALRGRSARRPLRPDDPGLRAYGAPCASPAGGPGGGLRAKGRARRRRASSPPSPAFAVAHVVAPAGLVPRPARLRPAGCRPRLNRRQTAAVAALGAAAAGRRGRSVAVAPSPCGSAPAASAPVASTGPHGPARREARGLARTGPGGFPCPRAGPRPAQRCARSPKGSLCSAPIAGTDAAVSAPPWGLRCAVADRSGAAGAPGVRAAVNSARRTGLRLAIARCPTTRARSGRGPPLGCRLAWRRA